MKRTVGRARVSRRRVETGYWVSGWPQLVAEWHPTRNGLLEPAEVTCGSGRKIWWKCPRGPDHEWLASPNNRTSSRTGCPYCAGRRLSVTNSLARLRPELAAQWHPTANGGLGPDDVVAGSTRAVWWRCGAADDHMWRASPHDRAGLRGACPFCLGLRVCTSNSLAATRPDLAVEWDAARNTPRTPRDVVEGSAEVVWWICRRASDHVWRASVCNRAVRRSGCPFCSGRRASTSHCLAASYPRVASEWHPTRNAPLTPQDVTPRARRIVWWRCLNGHEWPMRVSARTRRCGPCPRCVKEISEPAPGCASRPGKGTARGQR